MLLNVGNAMAPSLPALSFSSMPLLFSSSIFHDSLITCILGFFCFRAAMVSHNRLDFIHYYSFWNFDDRSIVLDISLLGTTFLCRTKSI